MRYWWVFGVCFLLSLLITPVFRWLAYRCQIVDKPEKGGRKRHAKSVAYLGGIAIFLVFILGIWLFAKVDRNILLMLGGLVLVVIIGLVDDILKLTPWQKLLGQILVGLILVVGGIGINSFPLPDGGYLELNRWVMEFSLGGVAIKLVLLSALFTLLWTVFLINSVNFLDGLDGLASGVTLIAFLIIFALSLTRYVNQSEIALLAVIMIGALMGFLPYNLPPASIFLGDSGSMMLGYVLAVLSILSGGKVATLVLVMGIVILDTIWVIISRAKNGKKIWSADRLHMHYRLLDRGGKTLANTARLLFNFFIAWFISRFGAIKYF